MNDIQNKEMARYNLQLKSITIVIMSSRIMGGL